ncbi:MAG: hypothetical protein II526_05745 [Erysipelotrichaceae bacterium]|nr:hypothetical protein [Erysipelotrichaceae bacterium]MBQ2505853.1 hypothetical protein [Erysipelotrichaceae bacterium]MBQ5444293.1 hypothetical protein [Erysipelotrichaceae bacterium]MEE3425136.1 hypothetical protein [Erysipelotrichaceae bacterium]
MRTLVKNGTIVDPDKIRVDESVPDFKPESIEHVFINGRQVMDKETYISSKAGELILRKGT